MTALPVFQHRVFGEDTPGWLIAGLAVLGTMSSMSAAVLLISALPDTLQSRIDEIGTDLSAGLPLAKDIGTPPVLTLGSSQGPAANPETQLVPSAAFPTSEAESLPTSVPDEIARSGQAVAGQGSADQVDESTGQQPDVNVSGDEVTPLREPSPLGDSMLADPRALVTPGADTTEMPLETASDASVVTTPDAVEGAVEAPSTPEAVPKTPPVVRKPEVVSSLSDAKTQPEAPPVAEEQAAGIESGEQLSGYDEDTCAPVFSIRFGRGGVRPLGTDLKAKAARLAEWLHARPEAKVYVEGHTDAVGPEEFNLLLSYRRANAVVSRLVEAGVARNQLSIRAYGETQPLEALKESGQNRRVVLSIDDAPACLEKIVEQ